MSAKIRADGIETALADPSTEFVVAYRVDKDGTWTIVYKTIGNKELDRLWKYLTGRHHIYARRLYDYIMRWLRSTS